MDIQFTFNQTSFVWNAHKAASNKSKHGISFEQATSAFFDPLFKLVHARTKSHFCGAKTL